MSRFVVGLLALLALSSCAWETGPADVHLMGSPATPGAPCSSGCEQ